ncbi:MAG: hypothetical protein IJH37_11160 [Clostridia bacterium]|nr:hypothetical protein [Clostridia bacterium]
MKKFTKIMLSTAAITAVSAAMAISAMAAEVSVSGDFAGKYDTDTGVITLDSAVKSTENSTTLLVVDTDGTVAEANIFQIDQDDESQGFSEIKLDASKIVDGTYYIRVGGDGTVKTASFTIGGEPVEKDTKTVYIGDVDDDDEIGVSDGVFVARYIAEFEENIGNAGAEAKTADDADFVYGDVDDDQEVGVSDGVFIARYIAEFEENIGNTGSTIDIVVE